MAEEVKDVEVKQDPSENNAKHRRRSRSPINAPGRRGRGGRGPGRGGGRRYGGYRGFDRSADEIDNTTNSEDPHLKRARLFVGNITTESVTRRDLAQLFGQYGRVLGVSVHGGFAFVQMERERDANRAIICEDGQQFKGSRIRKFISHSYQISHLLRRVLSLLFFAFFPCALLDVEYSQAAKEAGARRGTVHPFKRKELVSFLPHFEPHLPGALISMPCTPLFILPLFWGVASCDTYWLLFALCSCMVAEFIVLVYLHGKIVLCLLFLCSCIALSCVHLLITMWLPLLLSMFCMLYTFCFHRPV